MYHKGFFIVHLPRLLEPTWGPAVYPPRKGRTFAMFVLINMWHVWSYLLNRARKIFHDCTDGSDQCWHWLTAVLQAIDLSLTTTRQSGQQLNVPVPFWLHKKTWNVFFRSMRCRIQHQRHRGLRNICKSSPMCLMCTSIGVLHSMETRLWPR